MWEVLLFNLLHDITDKDVTVSSAPKIADTKPCIKKQIVWNLASILIEYVILAANHNPISVIEVQVLMVQATGLMKAMHAIFVVVDPISTNPDRGHTHYSYISVIILAQYLLNHL